MKLLRKPIQVIKKNNLIFHFSCVFFAIFTFDQITISSNSLITLIPNISPNSQKWEFNLKILRMTPLDSHTYSFHVGMCFHSLAFTQVFIFYLAQSQLDSFNFFPNHSPQKNTLLLNSRVSCAFMLRSRQFSYNCCVLLLEQKVKFITMSK